MATLKRPPKAERHVPNPSYEGFVAYDQMTFAERDELAALARAYALQVDLISASRSHATVYLKEGDASITVWKYMVSEGTFEFQKTVRGEGALHFKSADLFRYAFLRCREAILAVRMAHMEHNVRATLNPGPRKIQKAKRRALKAQQYRFPFLELHSKSKTTT